MSKLNLPQLFLAATAAVAARFFDEFHGLKDCTKTAYFSTS
jgi:hypothetical protein